MIDLNINVLPSSKEKSAVWKLHDAALKHGIPAIKQFKFVWRQYLELRPKQTKKNQFPNPIIFRCELRAKQGSNYEFIAYRKEGNKAETCLGSLILVDAAKPDLFNIAFVPMKAMYRGSTVSISTLN